MTISLSDAGKRFNRDWIFRHFNYNFESGQSYAIIGPNGSGKSTLLQVLGGSMMLSEGSIEFAAAPKDSGLLRSSGQWAVARESGVGSRESVTAENIYQHVSICAPYLELVEEMTVKEFLEFHFGFKPKLSEVSIEQMISTVGLEKAIHKQIRYYSSGMKQRVKLLQSVFSASPIILLDEPCTNLDAEGVSVYHRLVADYCHDKLVIISSNDEVEYSFCKNKLNITDWK